MILLSSASAFTLWQRTSGGTRGRGAPGPAAWVVSFVLSAGALARREAAVGWAVRGPTAAPVRPAGGAQATARGRVTESWGLLPSGLAPSNVATARRVMPGGRGG